MTTPTQDLIERLLRQDEEMYSGLCAEAASRLTELQDEVVRMRKALQLIAECIHPKFRAEDDIDLLYANEKAFGQCINVARAALDQQGERG